MRFEVSLSQLNSFEMFMSSFALKCSPEGWGFVALSTGAGRVTAASMWLPWGYLPFDTSVHCGLLPPTGIKISE